LKVKLPIANLETATFECVFPKCGGICCKQGRPPVAPGEAERIQSNLEKFLPHLRSSARRVIEKQGFLTKRRKQGHRAMAVDSGWCVFFNEGCVLHKVGAHEGDRYKYKPFNCVLFPLDLEDGKWHVRQWGYPGEEWDIFCLNPDESKVPASESLKGEIEFALSDHRWRRLDETE
jgi:Fe-S-cluster containining protein